MSLKRIVHIFEDGRMVLKKGYGFADREKRRSADPDHTLFRIGSVTNYELMILSSSQ